MKLGLNLAAACGLAAFLALSAPASAASITYDLAGDTATITTFSAHPQWRWLDLTDAGTGSDLLPGRTLNVGDTVNLTVTLNNPVSFTGYTVYLQDSPVGSLINFSSTYSYFLGGVSVPTPTPSSNWATTSGSYDALSFGEQYVIFGPDEFSFDKVIVNAVITSMADPSSNPISSLALAESYPGISLYNFNPVVAATPLPGGLLLMMTALGGLGIVARRKRAASAEA